MIKFKPGVVGEGEGKETKAHELEVHTTVSPEEATIETTVEKLSSGKSKEAKEKDGVTVSVEKIPSEVEKTGQEVGVGGEKEENQNEKPTESFVVEKVKEKEPEKEKQIPAQSSVTKLANDRQSDDEEVDLEGGKLKESEGVISIQKISPAKGNEVQEKISTNEENVNKEPAVRIRVEKVADAVEETKEKKADESRGVTVEKVGNIQAKQEEEDLETEGNGKSEIAESQEKRNDIQVEVVKERREIDQVPGQVTVEKLANDYEKNDLGIREAGKREIKEVMVTVQKDESEEPIAAEAKRSQIQKASEDEDLGVRVEKLPMETSLSNDASLESEKTITVKVEKFQPSTVSVEAQKVAKPNVEVTVEKLKAPLPSMKPAVETEEPTSKRVFEEEKLPSEVPTTERPDEFKATVEKITSEEEDLKNSGGQLKAEVEKVPSQDELLEGIQLRDAIRKTEKSQDEEQELENEQEQELETEQETPEERKLALEFEKALKEERNNKQNLKTKSLKPPSLTSPSVTNKPHEATTEELATKETESGKKAVKSENESKRGMTIEELELAELANNVLSDDNEKMKTEPGTERPLPPTTAATTTAEKVLVVKVQEQRNITVTVTKEQNENLLSEKETAQEEKKLKEELAKELKQEKAVVRVYLYSSIIQYVIYTKLRNLQNPALCYLKKNRHFFRVTHRAYAHDVTAAILV